MPYASRAGLLRALRDVVGRRVGIITTLGPSLTNADALALLPDTGLDEYLDSQGFVSDRDAGVAKPHVAIYQFGAHQLDVPVGRCLYVGESLVEVLGALTASMIAVLKPCLPG